MEDNKQNIDELIKEYKENPNRETLSKMNDYYIQTNNYYAIYQVALEGFKYNESVYYYNAGTYLSNIDREDYDLKRAIEYLEISAKKGSKKANYRLAELYYEKKYGVVDCNKSLMYLQEYDRLDGTTSYKHLGLIYYKMRDYKNALKYLLEAINRGQNLYFYLGYIYSNENGGYLNYHLAVECYQKALESENLAPAYNNLAILYKNGQGVEKDYQKAFELMSKAYELGSKAAIKNLASYYRYGIGCEVNLQKSFELLEEMEDKENNPFYFEGLGRTYYCSKNYQKALDAYKKSASMGDKFSQLEIVLILTEAYKKEINYIDDSLTKEKIYEMFNELYLEGLKVCETEEFKNIFFENCLLNSSRDFINERRKIADSRAYSFSKMVGNKNFVDIFKEINIDEWCARGILGYCLINEMASDKENSNYILNYSDSGYSNINYLLGRKYEIGYKVEVDLQKAFEYYQKATYQGHPMAYSRLAFFYQNGIVVEKDIKKAKEYHEVAARDALIGDTSLNTNEKEHRGVVESQLALAKLDELEADRINDVYLNPPSLPSSLLPKLPEYNKKAIYKNVMMRYDYAYTSHTLAGKIAYVEFYLKNRDLYSGDNLDVLVEEIKDKSDSLELLKYYELKNETETIEKIKDNILRGNDYEKVKKLLISEESKKNDISRILLKLASLGDEESLYKFKLLNLEKNSDEYKKIIYEMANQDVYRALLEVLEYEPNNTIYLHKVLDDPRIQFHLEISNKYRPILGEYYYSVHQYDKAHKYLLDKDKHSISLYLEGLNIDNTFLKTLIDLSKNISLTSIKNNVSNYDYLKNELNLYLKKYQEIKKSKDYYNHLGLLSDQKHKLIEHLKDYINTVNNYNLNVYDILVGVLYTEVYTYLGNIEKDEKIKMTIYNLGMQLGSYYSSYNYAYLLYKNNPGIFKASIRKEAIKIMEKIQYYFKPAYDWLNKYEKKFVKYCNSKEIVDYELLIDGKVID